MTLYKKPFIFLDIDGTIASSIHAIDDGVASYLTELSGEGYFLVFVTGRSYKWAKKGLSFLKSPFILAVQNGAQVSLMPAEEVLKKNYFHKKILAQIDALNLGHDYVIYTGMENDFRCYYRGTLQDKKLLLQRSNATHEVWEELKSYDDLPIDTFPAIKFFGDKKALTTIAKTLEKSLNIFIPVILDPVIKGNAVAQGTLTNKGDVIDIITEIYGKGPIIAAGDDMNDLEMLKKADIKLAIETAPQEILEISDIICKGAEQAGIVEGLKKAIERLYD